VLRPIFEYTIRFAICITPNSPAYRVGSLRRDPASCQSLTVGKGDMIAGAVDKHGMVQCHGIKLVAMGMPLFMIAPLITCQPR
jgi:hypothetical protein